MAGMKKTKAKGAARKAHGGKGPGEMVSIDADELTALRNLAKFPIENPSPILRVTREGRVLYANDAALAIKGLVVGQGQGRLAAAVAKVANNAAVSCPPITGPHGLGYSTTMWMYSDGKAAIFRRGCIEPAASG